MLRETYLIEKVFIHCLKSCHLFLLLGIILADIYFGSPESQTCECLVSDPGKHCERKVMRWRREDSLKRQQVWRDHCCCQQDLHYAECMEQMCMEQNWEPAPDDWDLRSFFLKKSSWNIAGLQCFVNFRCIAKWFSYTYIYIYIYVSIYTVSIYTDIYFSVSVSFLLYVVKKYWI